MAVPCGDWNTQRSHTHTRIQGTSPISPPPATAAVLREAAVPLADQILSVAFPLINGHLLPPFSLHGYTLSLCSSNHLIVTTFNPSELACLRCLRLLPAYTCLPHSSWRVGDTRARKQTNHVGSVHMEGRHGASVIGERLLLFLASIRSDLQIFKHKTKTRKREERNLQNEASSVSHLADYF